MTTFRFDRIPDVLIAIAYLLIGWQMIFGIEREFRIAERETATFPIIACGVFLDSSDAE